MKDIESISYIIHLGSDEIFHLKKTDGEKMTKNFAEVK